RQSPIPLSTTGILILGLLLATPSCLGYFEDLIKCFQDPEYESILVTAQKGLHASPLPKRVVIVGAGMSGLAAARPYKIAVTILEASHHIGGRVVTYRNEEEGWYYELGPMRIPKSHRLVHTYIKKLGLKMNKFIEYDGNTWYPHQRTTLSHQDVKDNPELLGYSTKPMEKGKGATNLFNQSITKVPPASPLPGLGKKTSSGPRSPGKLWMDPASLAYLLKEGALSQGAVKMIGTVMNEDSGYYKSLLDFSEITGGFDQLPRALSTSLKPGTIHLGSKVEAVVRDGPEVQVSYRAGEPSSAKHNLTADFVIISASAKATRLITFKPPLSPDKVEALRVVHYTSATKVVLACKEPFWEREGIRGGVSVTDRPSRFIYYPSHSLPSGKGVLLASYTVDDDSLFFISMTHEQVEDVVLEDLAAVHQIPKDELRRMCPSSVLKRWSLDPLTMGAFAEFTPYQFTDYSLQLFQPEGRIHFAGEHTSMPHAWIDTAIKSGLRAARNIQAAVDEEATRGHH
uniref:Amine oxidase n=1 Tax=Lynx canadensis TaxID=61383 RepID=A0A667G3F7_LYNCA